MATYPELRRSIEGDIGLAAAVFVDPQNPVEYELGKMRFSFRFRLKTQGLPVSIFDGSARRVLVRHGESKEWREEVTDIIHSQKPITEPTRQALLEWAAKVFDAMEEELEDVMPPEEDLAEIDVANIVPLVEIEDEGDQGDLLLRGGRPDDNKPREATL